MNTQQVLPSTPAAGSPAAGSPAAGSPAAGSPAAKRFCTATVAGALFIAATLFSSSTLFAQVKIGTAPTVIGANNNLEVEASTAGRKTSIDKTTGQVTIADGTQGAAKVLTSDANGGASWQSQIGINQLVFAGYRAATQSIAEDNSGIVIQITSEYDPNTGWNAGSNEYTIATAGYYSVSFGGKLSNTSSDGASIPGSYALWRWNALASVWDLVVTYTAVSLPGFFRSLGGSIAVKVAAGDKFRVQGAPCSCVATQTWTSKETTLVISKIL